MCVWDSEDLRVRILDNVAKNHRDQLMEGSAGDMKEFRLNQRIFKSQWKTLK